MISNFVFPIIISIELFIYAEDFLKKNNYSVMILFSFFLVTIFLYFIERSKHEELKGNAMTVDVFFVLFFSVVHFLGVFLNFFFGTDILTKGFYYINYNYIDDAVLFSLIGLQSFVAGYFYKFRKRKKYKFNENIKLPENIEKAILTTSVFLFVFSVLYFYEMFLKGAFSEGYSGSVRGYASGIFIVGTLFFQSILMPMVFVYFFSNIKNKETFNTKFLFLPFFSIIFNVLSNIIIGDRDFLLSFVLIILITYSMIIKKMGILSLFTFIFLGSFIMGVIGYARNYSNKDMELYKETANDFAEDTEGFLSGIRTLSDSFRTVTASIEAVEKEGYFYGKLHLADILGVVPFAGKFIYSPEPQYVGSAGFLTWYIREGDFSSGEGSSYVADLYLEFGLFGITIISFFIGLLTAYLFMKKSFFWMIIFLVWIQHLIGTSRGNINISKPLLWPIIYLSIMFYILKIKERKDEVPE